MLTRTATSKMRFTPVNKNISKLLDIQSLKRMDTISAFNPSPLTLQQFVEFGKAATEQDSYNFIKREVPIRLANIMKEINLLPSSLLQMPSVLTLQVRGRRDETGSRDYSSVPVCRNGTLTASWTCARSRAAPTSART